MSSFQQHAQAWDDLAAHDPLWAIASEEGRRYNHWDLREFLQSGLPIVDRYVSLIEEPGPTPHFRHVLDFGCGVGRLSLAWLRYANHVTGVDVARLMIEQAREIAGQTSNVTYLYNPSDDLAALPSNEFDLVFSHICLQHIEWPFAEKYIREFARVCSPDGIVAFQLPTRMISGYWLPRIRRRLVESLPFGLSRVYRKLRHGSSSVYNVYFTPSQTVLDVASSVGLRTLRLEPDKSAGANTEGFIYIFRKG